jgi:hypothetical protein
MQTYGGVLSCAEKNGCCIMPTGSAEIVKITSGNTIFIFLLVINVFAMTLIIGFKIIYMTRRQLVAHMCE